MKHYSWSVYGYEFPTDFPERLGRYRRLMPARIVAWWWRWRHGFHAWVRKEEVYSFVEDGRLV